MSLRFFKKKLKATLNYGIKKNGVAIPKGKKNIENVSKFRAQGLPGSIQALVAPGP